MGCYNYDDPVASSAGCNCTSDDILYKGTSDACTGIATDNRLTQIIGKLLTYGKTKLSTVTPSSSISVSVGVDSCGSTAQPSVKVSSVANNILSIVGDGLYAAAPAGQTISVAITPTISLTLSGAGLVTAHAKVSATAGNRLTIAGDGLFVPPLPATQTVTVGNTPTINLNLASGLITANTNLSAFAGNNLTARGDGLYVPTPVPSNVYTVNNGLTETSGLFQLGGNLIKDTTVGYFGYKLAFGDAYNYKVFQNGYGFEVHIDKGVSGYDPNGYGSIAEYFSNHLSLGIYKGNETDQPRKYLKGGVNAGISNAYITYGEGTTNDNMLAAPVDLETTSYVKVSSGRCDIKATGLYAQDIKNTKNDTVLSPQLNVLYTDENGKVNSAPFIPKVYASATLDFTTAIDPQTSDEDTFSLANVKAGDNILVNAVSINPANTSITAYIAADGVVTVRINNYSAIAVTPGSVLVNVVVFKQPVIVACVAVGIAGSQALNTVTVGTGTPYYQEMVLTGSMPVTITDIVAPAWMTIGHLNGKLQFSGYPIDTDVTAGATVSMTIANACGSIAFSQTIVVNPA